MPGDISLPARQPQSRRALLQILELNLRVHLQGVASFFSPDQFLSLLLLCSCMYSCSWVMEGTGQGRDQQGCVLAVLNSCEGTELSLHLKWKGEKFGL